MTTARPGLTQVLLTGAGWAVECVICGVETRSGHALPMHEGEVTDDPDEWAGFPACVDCYEKHTPGNAR
jgi:hypothetical protein